MTASSAWPYSRTARSSWRASCSTSSTTGGIPYWSWPATTPTAPGTAASRAKAFRCRRTTPLWTRGGQVALQTQGDTVTAIVIAAGDHLFRFDANGTPDGNFGSEGQVISDFGTFSAVAIQPDGKI